MWTPSKGPPDVARVRVVLAAALVCIALALGLTLSHAPTVVIRTNSTPPVARLATTYSAAAACQDGEALPAGASAIRLALLSDTGPHVRVTVTSGAHTLTSGAADSGWTGSAVTAPIKAPARTRSSVRLCFELGPTAERVGIVGAPTPPAVAATGRDGRRLPGRVSVEYLRTGRSPWSSLALTVARRMGLGRMPAGSWIVLPPIALMGASIALACWALLRELK
jgi:hypothetical protein